MKKYEVIKKGRKITVDKEVLEQEVKSATDMTPYELNKPLAKIEAKKLYIIHGWNIERIQRVLDIPLATLQNWINSGDELHISWKQEREIFLNTVTERVKNEKANILSDILGVGADILLTGLMHIKNTQKALTVRELRQINDVVNDTYKNLNLEQGKPTEIKANFKGTEEELKNLLVELNEVSNFNKQLN